MDYHNPSHDSPHVDMTDISREPRFESGPGMNAKFMQTLEKGVYMELKAMAKERGVTVQEFLRAVIVPDWMRTNGRDIRTSSRSRTH